MIRKQDRLSAIINSLSKNEKRYFKVQASQHSGDKIFTQLFDELAKSKTYEPDKLSKKLGISKPLLAHTKNYLEKVLMSTIRLYEQDRDPNIWLNNQWQTAQILYNRNHFEQALSINNKGLEKALACENFVMTLSFLSLDYLLNMTLGKEKEAEKGLKQRAICVEQINEAEQIAAITRRFNKAALGRAYDKGALQQIAQSPMFKIKPERLKSNIARIRWHELKQNYSYFAKRNLKTAIYHNLSVLNIIDAQPQIIYTTSRSLLLALQYVGAYYDKMGKFDEALEVAARMEFETNGHRKGIPVTLCKQFNITARLQQVYLLCHQQKYAEAAKKAEEFKNETEALNEGNFVIVKYHYALGLFHTGKYDAALKICEELQGSSFNSNIILLFSSKILMFMIHYQLGNYTLLPHLLSSITTWAKRHNISQLGTHEFIEWLGKLEEAKNAASRSLWFVKFSKVIEKSVFNDYVEDLGLKAWVKHNL